MIATGHGSIDAAVFDLDGVLIDSWPVMEKAYLQACRLCACRNAAPLSEFRTHLGRPLEEIADRLALPADFASAFRSQSRLHLALHRIYPGIHGLLTRLGSLGLHLAVNTGKDRLRTLEVLDLFRLTDHFEMIVSGDDPVQGKPAPDSLLLIARHLHLSASRVAFIGDSSIDMRCAVRAESVAIAALWGFGDRHSLRSAGAGFEAESPEALEGLLIELRLGKTVSVSGRRGAEIESKA